MSRSSGRSAIETELKSFAVRAFRVDFDDSGELLAASPVERTTAPWLRRFGLRRVRLDGQLVRWTACQVLIDADEVEQTWTAADAVVTVRHSFGADWRTRIILTNPAATARIAVLTLAVEPGESCRDWVGTSAAESTYALLPQVPELPILVARNVGAPVGIGPESLEHGPITLEPGDRFVAAWDWGSVRRPLDVAGRLPAELPRQSTVEVGTDIWVPAGPDAAVVAPPGVEVHEEGNGHAVSAAEPGRHRVEIRSARGSTVLELGWATPPADFLIAAAERALSAAPGPNGVVRLPDLAAALVVQRAAREGFPAAVAASDALDLFTARMLDAGIDAGIDAGTDPDGSPTWAAIFLTGEYNRLGDPDLVTEAGRRLSTAPARQPGLGLAVLRARLAAVLADRPPLRLPNEPPTQPAATGWSGQDVATALELSLVTESPQRHVRPAVATLLYRMGVVLAAGLPSRAPADLSVADLGHCLAVLSVVPDDLHANWRAQFGTSISELVHARTLELVERLEGTPVAEGHAWLTITG